MLDSVVLYLIEKPEFSAFDWWVKQSIPYMEHRGKPHFVSVVIEQQS